MSSAQSAGYDVIDGQLAHLATAILAGVTVALEDFPAGEINPGARS